MLKVYPLRHNNFFLLEQCNQIIFHSESIDSNPVELKPMNWTPIFWSDWLNWPFCTEFSFLNWEYWIKLQNRTVLSWILNLLTWVFCIECVEPNLFEVNLPNWLYWSLLKTIYWDIFPELFICNIFNTKELFLMILVDQACQPELCMTD